MTVSMDANFGLVRKCNGSSSEPPLFRNNYFLDSNEVDNFLSSYGNDNNTKDKVIMLISNYEMIWFIVQQILSL